MAQKKAKEDGPFTRLKREYFRAPGLSEASFSELLSRPYDFQKSFFSSLSVAARPMIGIGFPKSWDELRSPSDNRKFLDPSEATRWTALKLGLSSEIISSAVLEQRRIEHQLMLGNYPDVFSSLSEFERRFGVSLWSLDLHFLTCGQVDGFHGNRFALAEFCRAVKSDWARLLVGNSSYRCQDNLSNRDYTSTYNVIIDKFRSKGIQLTTLTYLLYRYLDVMPSEDSEYCTILRFESRNPLLDQYHTFMRLAAARSLSGLSDTEVGALCDLADDVQDPSMTALASIASRMVYHRPSSQDDSLRRCSEAYLLSDFARAKSMAINLLEASATEFVHFDIAASASARLGEDCPRIFRDHSMAQVLLQTLHDWYSAKRHRRDSIEDLQRFARGLHSLRIGPALNDFVNLIDNQLPLLGNECLSLLATPSPLPNHALTFTDKASGALYLDNYCRQVGHSPGTKLIDEYLQLCTEPWRDSAFLYPSENLRLRYKSAALISAGQFASAAETLAKLRSSSIDFVKLHPELYAGEALALFEMQQFERAATLMADLYCEDPRSIPPALLRRFGDLLNQDRFRPERTNVAWPVLAAAILKEEGRTITIDRVHDFVGDFIEAHKVTRPTELLALDHNLTKSLVVFLTDCCTPEILESSIWYGSQEELLRERLALCTKLQEIDQFDSMALHMELADLTRRLAIMDITNRIDRSRIYVDTSKIIDLVDEKTLDQTDRMLQFLSLDNKELRWGIKIIQLPSAEGGRFIVVSVDEALSLFEEIFETLKKQFLDSPELGLDANLSQRVRHGIFANSLRPIFDRLHLTTKKDVDGVYQINQHWLSQMDPRDAATAESIDGAFRDFSKKIDDTIQLVREEWVQIKSDTKSKGLFDYSFTSVELAEILDSISHMADPDDVYEVALESLWLRTEACLGRVRNVVTGELHDMLKGYLDELQNEVENRATQSLFPSFGSLRSAITLCKTDLARELPKIANWFRIESHKEHKNFDFQDLVRSVEQVLNRINSHCTVTIDSDSVISTSLPGAYLGSLWDLLQILFDNAVKHSGLPKADLLLNAYFAGGEARLTCTNTMTTEQNVDRLREKVGILNRLTLENERDLSMIRQEGGSGIAKMHKIVRHDMGRASGHRIRFDVTADGNFQVQIDFGGAIYNETPPR